MVKILDKIKNFFKTKKEVFTPLDPETIRVNRIVQGQAQEIQGLKAQLSKFKAEKNKEKDEEIKNNIQDLVKEKLLDEEKKIKQKRFGESFSFNRFYWELFKNKKFIMEICDKDDKKVFGKFGQFLVLESGRFAITDENGNVVSYGKCLNQVIYKPGTLLNQMRRGRILIPYDADYNPAIDFEEVEASDIKYDDEEKVYRLTQRAREKAEKLLMEKDKELRKTSQLIDRLENMNIDYKKENDELKRTVKLQKGMVETSNSELSQVMESFSQFQQSYGDIQRKVTSLTELKAMYEDVISRQESTIKEVLNQLEEAGDKTQFRKALAMVKEVLDYAKTRLPQQVIIKDTEFKETMREMEGGKS